MTTVRTWHRSPWWDRAEPAWKDDGCDHLRIAAVASIPNLHPRTRRALELTLRSTAGPEVFAEHGAAQVGRWVRAEVERRLEELRVERLIAEERAADEAWRARVAARGGP